jgi:hypothetical protein
MNGDIVARLRDQEEFGLLGVPGDHRSVSYGDAADEIERLRAALERIAEHDMQAIAMDALRPGERIRAPKTQEADHFADAGKMIGATMEARP